MFVKGLAVTLAGLFTVLVTSDLIPLHAQSLADVAKKEEDRRKQTTQRPSKVYTNKDLGSVPASSAPPPPESVPASGGDSASNGGAKNTGPAPATAKADDKGPAKDKEKDKTKDQAYWAGRQKALRDGLDRDTSFADAMQSKINALTTEFVNRGDPAQRAVIERNRQKALADLDQLKKQIIADKKAIADFEEEARRAGIPPGWLR